MVKYHKSIPIRKTIFDKLLKVANHLREMNDHYQLQVVYGYRAMEIQEKYFYEIYHQVKDNFENETKLYEYIHEKVAVPSVAGHPTGGAVDIEIIDKVTKEPLNFGSDILDWDSEKVYYENDLLTAKERENRQLLRNVMLKEGFAPYDGEWWHFSYGDKEWAFYYGKKKALYNQVEAKQVYQDKV